MKQQIENMIKENLPENMETCTCEEDIGYHTKECNFLPFGFNDCLSQINTSLIAGEVLKVLVEKIKEEVEKYEPAYESEDKAIVSFGKQLLSTLSTNKENEIEEIPLFNGTMDKLNKLSVIKENKNN